MGVWGWGWWWQGSVGQGTVRGQVCGNGRCVWGVCVCGAVGGPHHRATLLLFAQRCCRGDTMSAAQRRRARIYATRRSPYAAAHCYDAPRCSATKARDMMSLSIFSFSPPPANNDVTCDVRHDYAPKFADGASLDLPTRCCYYARARRARVTAARYGDARELIETYAYPCHRPRLPPACLPRHLPRHHVTSPLNMPRLPPPGMGEERNGGPPRVTRPNTPPAVSSAHRPRFTPAWRLTLPTACAAGA